MLEIVLSLIFTVLVAAIIILFGYYNGMSRNIEYQYKLRKTIEEESRLRDIKLRGDMIIIFQSICDSMPTPRNKKYLEELKALQDRDKTIFSGEFGYNLYDKNSGIA